MTDPTWWAPARDTRRSSGRTWTVRGVVSAVLAAALVAGAATVGATSPHVASSSATTQGRDVRPSVRALAVGCGPAQFVTDPTSRVGAVNFTGELPYWPLVPVSGWFATQRAARDDLAASPEQVLNGMWFGDRAIWVARDAPAQTTGALRALAAANPQWRAVVRVWPAARRDQLDPGTYASASWGLTQTCRTPDRQVIDELFTAAPAAPGRDGQQVPSGLRLSADHHQRAQER